MRNSIFNHKNLLFFLVAILIPLGTPLSFSDQYITTVFIYSIVLFIYYRKKLDLFLIVILVLWCVVNFFAYHFNESNFSFYTFLGMTIKISLSYFALKVIGWNLLNKTSSIVYSLTIISLPLFFLRILVPQFFEILNPIFNLITADFLQERGWYSLVFTYDRTTLRNSGFMWEPGAYAMMLNIAILDFLNRNNYKIDKKIIILLVALLSTLSTMGYFSLLVLLIFIISGTRNYKLSFLIVPLLALFAQDIINLDFLQGKLSLYIDHLNSSYLRVGTESLKVNRFSLFLVVLNEVYTYPFGYGVVTSDFVMNKYGLAVSGVGGISTILRMWGVLGGGFLVVAIFKYYKLISKKKKILFPIIATIIIIFSFFSNPVEKNPILYFIIFYPFVYGKFYKRLTK